jgi:hypothetical protein
VSTPGCNQQTNGQGKKAGAQVLCRRKVAIPDALGCSFKSLANVFPYVDFHLTDSTFHISADFPNNYAPPTLLHQSMPYPTEHSNDALG